MLQGDRCCPSVQGDLWARIAEIIRGAPADFVHCSWKRVSPCDRWSHCGRSPNLEEAATQANADSLATQGVVCATLDPMSMFDDIGWTRRGNSEKCISNSRSEKKSYGNTSHPPEGK